MAQAQVEKQKMNFDTPVEIGTTAEEAGAVPGVKRPRTETEPVDGFSLSMIQLAKSIIKHLGGNVENKELLQLYLATLATLKNQPDEFAASLVKFHKTIGHVEVDDSSLLDNVRKNYRSDKTVIDCVRPPKKPSTKPAGDGGSGGEGNGGEGDGNPLKKRKASPKSGKGGEGGEGAVDSEGNAIAGDWCGTK